MYGFGVLIQFQYLVIFIYAIQFFMPAIKMLYGLTMRVTLNSLIKSNYQFCLVLMNE